VGKVPVRSSEAPRDCEEARRREGAVLECQVHSGKGSYKWEEVGNIWKRKTLGRNYKTRIIKGSLSV